MNIKSKELANIAEFVINKTGQDIYNPGRGVELIDARTLYYVLARETTSYTCYKIGKEVGKSHATVLHGLKAKDIMLKESLVCSMAYERYNDINNLSLQTKLVETIRELEYKVDSLSKPLTDNEIAYRRLPWKQQLEYDERAKWALKSFGWKDREANRKEIFEIINCSE